MANYDNLRAAINQAITANGVGAITGLLLNSVLQAMVTALGNGYQFVGIATPSTNPGNPDQNVFYLAYEGGTYVNFGQLQVTRGFNIIKRDNVTWSVEQLTSVDDVLTANGNNPVTSGAAFGIGANIAYYDLTLSPAVYPANVGANVVAKTITINGFKLMSGGCIRVKFPNNNTATQPTLNISETGAKPLYYNGKRVSAANTWKANEVVEFYYDGTNWQGKKAVEVFKTINSQSLLGDGNISINDFYYLEFGEDAEEAINVLSRTNRQVVCIYTILTPTLQEISIKMFAHSFNASTGKIDFSGVVGNTLYYCSVTNAIQWSEVQTLDLTAEEQETYRMTYGSTGNIWNEVQAFATGKYVTVIPNIPDATFDIPVCIAYKIKTLGLGNSAMYFYGIANDGDINRFIEVRVQYMQNISHQTCTITGWDVTSKEIGDVTNEALTILLATKQNLLQSGVNIKTINGQSILGGGNLNLDFLTMVAINELPIAGVNTLNKIYLVPSRNLDEAAKNIKEEWVTIQQVRDITYDGVDYPIIYKGEFASFLEYGTTPGEAGAGTVGVILLTSYDSSTANISSNGIISPFGWEGKQIGESSYTWDSFNPKLGDSYVNVNDHKTYVCTPTGWVDIESLPVIYNWELIGSTQVNLDNYYTKTEINTALNNKQDTLQSGTNIKTINGSSILGRGNINIEKAYFVDYGDVSDVSRTIQNFADNLTVICRYASESDLLNLFAIKFDESTGILYFSGISDTNLYLCSLNAQNETWSAISTINITDSEVAIVTTNNTFAEVEALYNAGKLLILKDSNEGYDRYLPLIDTTSGRSYYFQVLITNVEYDCELDYQDGWSNIRTVMMATDAKFANYYTKSEVNTALNNKQDTISDLNNIRSGASAGATAVQPATLNSALSNTVAESGVYDVSANNSGATFASLSALLSAQNLDTLIPVAKRKGGMSVKYVCTSDNKYVQYRLMSDTFNTTVSNWQGVDEEPIDDSRNLVQSGGAVNAITPLESQLKKQVSITNTVLAGGYINNSGGITTNASFSIKYAQVQKGDLVYIKTRTSGSFGGFALFSSAPTLQSVPVQTIAKTDIFYKVPQDCYIGVSDEAAHMERVGIFLYQYNVGRTICELLNDTFIEADVLYKGLCVFKNATNSLNGYINNKGVNAETSSSWKIIYAYVTKGTVIDSNGIVSGNFRAGFTDIEPVSGFILNTIIATDTTFPYVAERSGYFCISSGSPSSLYLKTKDAAPTLVTEEEITEINADISTLGKEINIIDERLVSLQTYDGYYIKANGSWAQLSGTAVRCYAVNAGDTYFIQSGVNTNYSLVGWCNNLPSQGSVADVNVPYVAGLSKYQKAPANANYMLISGPYSSSGGGVERYLYSFSVNLPHNNTSLNGQINTLRTQNLRKKALYIGDSISTGYNWREFLLYDYSFNFEPNKSAMPASVGGISLRPIQNEVTGHESIWWRCAEHRILNAGYTPSVISIFGGTNDMVSTSLPIGTAQDLPFVDDSSDFTVETYDASEGWPETITFCSALKGCILMMQRDYPNAEVIIPTVLYCGSSYGTWTPTGQSLIASEVIAKKQVEVAQVMGLRFVPWYWSERKQSTIDVFSLDNVHPSVAGARVMARWFADYLPL